MKKIILKAYQKKVLNAYQTFSPSKINLDKNKEKYFRNLEEIFFKKLSLDKTFFNNKNILDLGCGTGETDIFFKKYGARNVIGVDFNEKSIKQANLYKKKLNLKNIAFIHDDILKFRTKKKIDIIVCKGVLPHISKKDRTKLFENIKKLNLSKDSSIIFGFLDSAGNLIKLFQQIIINDLFKDKSDLEKFKYAKKLFKNNFKRFKKYGLREPIQVYYDYFVNQRSYGLSYVKILKYFNNYDLFSSYPFNLNLVNNLPINFNNNLIIDYNYFLFQQLHWFNNSQINFNSSNKNLFENYENALISKDLNLINVNNSKLKNGFENFKKNFIKNFDKSYKEFSEFNSLILNILDQKISINLKIEKIIKSKYFKKFCGIGTVYLTLKKN